MSSPRKEHSSTYFVADRNNQEEMTRLQLQDRMLTERMGGVLSEQSDPTIFQRVLDIGCGTGGWLIETAKAYPNMTLLIGIDISGKMLDYARAQAEANHVSNRVEFHIMDAMNMLEFPTGFFDLVNMRCAQSYLRTWDWPKILQEAQRVSKSGRVIRFTEADFVESDSAALNHLTRLGIQALHQAGYYFTPHNNGLSSHLAELMHRHGVQHIRTHTHTTEYRAGTPEGQLLTEVIRLAYRTWVPFMRKWTRLPDDYEAIYQQALLDMQAPNFVAKETLLTVWGTNRGSQEFFSEQ